MSYRCIAMSGLGGGVVYGMHLCVLRWLFQMIRYVLGITFVQRPVPTLSLRHRHANHQPFCESLAVVAVALALSPSHGAHLTVRSTMADTLLVDDTEKRLRSHKGVVGFMIMTLDGLAIRSTLPEGETTQYAALISRFVQKSRACSKQLCQDDDLQMVRIRSAKHEIMVALDGAGASEYVLVVVQDPTVPKAAT